MRRTSEILTQARRVLAEEADGIRALSTGLDERFVAVVRAIRRCRGQLIVTGLGKSGLVARKIAATLTSTGTPAVFVHPVEGLHGDVGIVTRRDLLLALSKSGHSGEITRFAQAFKRLGGLAVAVTEHERSALGSVCDLVLPLPKLAEADPHELAPTTSTTVALALGDALAITLLALKSFTAEDFARFHPDGTLGRRLLLRACDIMHGGDRLPKVAARTKMSDVVLEMTSKGLGITCVVNGDGRFLGTITDGDLRRLMQSTRNPLKLTAGEALTRSRRPAGPRGPFTVAPEVLAIRCREIMAKGKVTSLVVLDEARRPVGVVRIHEITAAGL